MDSQKKGQTIFNYSLTSPSLKASEFYAQLDKMIQFKDLLERSAFGVCSYLGEKMNIASSRVRLYFIYISFVTLGSPVIFYLFLAFWVNIRRYIKRHKDAFFG